MFKKFSALVHARFVELSKHELFVVGDDNRVFEAHYLASFPEGTNPIYKTSTEHDCSCCKQFIRNIGNVVAIIDGVPHSVWGVEGAPAPYDVVAKAMDSFVKALPITDLFRPTEPVYGAYMTCQLLPGGTSINWNHFHGKVAARHRVAQVDKVRGDYRTAVQLFKRGLLELSSTAIAQVKELIAEKNLYRGEEHLPAIEAFQKLQQAFDCLDTQVERDQFVWVNANEKGALFRNTVIGTVIQDLSDGTALEDAVKMFESKVAPENYKRPKALITAAMVAEAMKTINDEGLEPTLERRFAKISDVSVNNVLWVDNSVKGKMKGGLETLLMGAVAATPPKVQDAEDISIEDFMAKVLPVASSIDMLVSGRHMGNFVSLTAPVHENSGKLFKWANDFAWSYDGNIADSAMRQAVVARGGRVDGVFRFTHQWNHVGRNASLMDLHVFMPGNTHYKDGCHDNYGGHDRVGWNNRSHTRSGGVQDVDYTSAAPEGYVPVENITFPSLDRMPDGAYTCKIHNWNLRHPTTSGFRAEIEFGGQVFSYDYPTPLKHKEWVTVATVTKQGATFTIDHALPHGISSVDKWGLKTETFAKVNTVMYSPNYWDGNAVGNKHHFFILDGCLNDTPTRGIYNEFLNSGLEKHRKVFETLGDKTKCPVTTEQLSGLGFSSTRKDTVTVKVVGPKLNKVYNVTF